MRSALPLTRERFVTSRGEVRTSGALIRRILARHGIIRSYASAGGRTTGAAVAAAEDLVERVNSIVADFDLDASGRQSIADVMQTWFVKMVETYFRARPLSNTLGQRSSSRADPIRIQPDLELPFTSFVRDLLDAGIERSQSGAVAQHLVGAKLALRHRNDGVVIENHPFQAADLHTGRRGDFRINAAVFHVTMSPSEDVVLKCQDDLHRDVSPVLLVPKEAVASAERFLTAKGLVDRVWLLPIETFVAQNIAELSVFDRSRLAAAVHDLMDEYNRRVAEAESNTSILVEMPELN
jgi:hypothetical protein